MLTPALTPAGALQAWKIAAYAGIWLKLPIARSHLIPAAVARGFTFHHAESGYVMMTAWLAERGATLPPNASHQVGVGALVLNAAGEMLVVKERTGPAAVHDIWKVPTGLVLTGEDVADAAVREVEEETVRVPAEMSVPMQNKQIE